MLRESSQRVKASLGYIERREKRNKGRKVGVRAGRRNNYIYDAYVYMIYDIAM